MKLPLPKPLRDDLERSDIAFHVSPTADELVVSCGDRDHRFFIRRRGRAPYPGELDRLPNISDGLLVAPYVSEELGTRLIELGWSWADDLGNYDLRGKGLRFRRRVAASPPASASTRLFHPGASLALIRTLIEDAPSGERLLQKPLAARLGVTQGRISQIFSELVERGFLETRSRRTVLKDRAPLLEAFLEHYPGPGGELQFGATPRSPSIAAERIADWAERTLGDQAAVRFSADLSVDLVVPDRRPTHLVVYAPVEPDWSAMRLVEAPDRDSATVLWRIPEDESAFGNSPRLRARIRAKSLSLAAWTQQLWDLRELGGEDRLAALEGMKQWILDQPRP